MLYLFDLVKVTTGFISQYPFQALIPEIRSSSCLTADLLQSSESPTSLVPHLHFLFFLLRLYSPTPDIQLLYLRAALAHLPSQCHTQWQVHAHLRFQALRLLLHALSEVALHYSLLLVGEILLGAFATVLVARRDMLLRTLLGLLGDLLLKHQGFSIATHSA